MTNAMIMNVRNDEILTDEQLNIVAGGIDPQGIVNGIKKAIAMGVAGVESIQNLVDSHAYARMNNRERERALGKCLANNVAFNAIVASSNGLVGPMAVTYIQTRFRIVGVSSGLRELIEKEIKSN